MTAEYARARGEAVSRLEMAAVTVVPANETEAISAAVVADRPWQRTSR